jgi:hypothetical protein
LVFRIVYKNPVPPKITVCVHYKMSLIVLNMEIHDDVFLSIIKHLIALCGKVQFEMFAPLECCMAMVGSLVTSVS